MTRDVLKLIIMNLEQAIYKSILGCPLSETGVRLKKKPLKLVPNFVWRSYLGGSELREFRGTETNQDDHFPEDWLASTVRARNGKNQQNVDEGLSRLLVDGEEMVLIVLQGSGQLGDIAVAEGDTWLLPGGVSEWRWTATADHWEFLLAKAPVR